MKFKKLITSLLIITSDKVSKVTESAAYMVKCAEI